MAYGSGRNLQEERRPTVRSRSSRFSFSAVCPIQRQDPPCGKHSVNICLDESLDVHFLQSGYVVSQAIHIGTEQMMQVLPEGWAEVGNWWPSVWSTSDKRRVRPDICWSGNPTSQALMSAWEMHSMVNASITWKRKSISYKVRERKKIDKTKHFFPIFVWIWI